MKELLAEAMNEGAFGLSSQLAMPQARWRSTDDLIELCKTVREHGGISSFRTQGIEG